MNLVTIDIDSLPVGQPLPFALRSAKGTLLAPRGYTIATREELNSLKGRGIDICVDTDEASASHRHFMNQLQQMLRKDTPLGQIAALKLSLSERAAPSARTQGPPDWPEWQQRATQLLYTPTQAGFLEQLENLAAELYQLCREGPDAVLLALIFLSGQPSHQYSATHAMLVACASMLTARQTLAWPDDEVLRLGQAALSMNVAMTELQDALAQQTDALDARQLQAIHDHARQSELILRQGGVDDPTWLQAVRNHHQLGSGPLKQQGAAEQMARLIQRADVFGARISPRATRHAMPVTAAVQACYYGERREVDEAGAALLRTLGVYPPGAFVRLASDEIAIVLRRGASATTPRVAVVIGRSGMPTGEPIPRDTSQPAHKITATLPPHEVRLHVSLQRLLKLS